jgi:hypothetical protein
LPLAAARAEAGNNMLAILLGETSMSKILAAAIVLAIAGFYATPSYADCAADAKKAHDAAMKVTDAKKKEMAMKHATAAETHAKAKKDKECMEEVTKANAAMK